jgi:ectoine hydroxylase-related dioxygenase (phytanoyl-CoA dioxygenase family)
MNTIYFDRSANPEQIRQSYLQNGVVVIKNMIDREKLASLREVTLKVTYSRAQAAGIELPPGLELDEAFNRMCAVDRTLGGSVYTCLRHHPDAIKLITDQTLITYLELLLNGRDIYYAVDQIQFRIDRKSEEHFSLPWHQDYWWNNTSKYAVTVWYSFVDVPSELGPMRAVLGSHKEVSKIKVDPFYKVKWDQNKLFLLAEPVDEALGVELPVEAGDIVFMHALTLHRSGINTTDRNRWSIVTRYADMFDPQFVAKGWKSGIRVGYLSLLETDPECITNLDEVVEAPIAGAMGV